MNDLDEKQERRRQEQKGNKPIQEEVVSQQMLLLQNLQRDFQCFLDVDMSESDEDEKLFQQPSMNPTTTTAATEPKLDKPRTRRQEVQVYGKLIEPIKEVF